MGMLDCLLAQVAGNVDVANLAAKVGLTPAQVEAAVAALGAAHPQPGDTAGAAAASTGLPVQALRQIIGHIGGEGALGRFSDLLGNRGAEPGSADTGIEGMLGGLAGRMFGKD
ncbi:hypothetical protein [Sphingomonas profundi]|uniref:hypothetical protein n=1 Tax=Alterirhizorhabdus profundi TaxID=2681549 RepID=UPI0012E83907|nr:hypothetical protein [Sphingomonas profundi]